MGAKFIIGNTIERGMDKRNERHKSRPTRKIKVKIGKESRAATRV
jgi:hypothetical protein